MSQSNMFENYSDSRNQSFCIHCGNGLGVGELNREHVPTKSLFMEPYPENLPTVQVHSQCNSDYSLDEQYVVALLASTISGSTEPDSRHFPSADRLLQRSPALRIRIDQSRWVRGTATEWTPEIKRVERVLLKNARGHAFVELGLPFIDQPSYIGFSPIAQLSSELRAGFDRIPKHSLWPEVGSRLMQQVACDPFYSSVWKEMQPGVYRYLVSQLEGKTIVKVVVYEYLAAEVGWE